jgi:hypothetical protein
MDAQESTIGTPAPLQTDPAMAVDMLELDGEGVSSLANAADSCFADDVVPNSEAAGVLSSGAADLITDIDCIPTPPTHTIEDVLAAEGMYVSSSAGRSMFPLLRDRRDAIVVTPPPLGQDLQRYDVALYRSGGRYVLHRVLRAYPDHYEIRGDNCIAVERVPKADVIGVLAEAYRGNRHIDLHSRSYKLYSKVWVAINPLVRTYQKARRAIARALR